MKPPLCGNKVEHDYWIGELFTCPLCARIKQDKREKQILSDFAVLVANAIVERLKKDQT